MNLYSDLPPEFVALAEAEDREFEEHLATASDAEITTRDVLWLARVLKNLEAQEEALHFHVVEVERKEAALNNRIAHLKEWIQYRMTESGIDRAKDSLVSVWLANNPKSIEITDIEKVPGAYLRASIILPYEVIQEHPFLEQFVRDGAVTVMKAAILKDVEETGALPEGVALVKDKKHLRVR